MYYRIMCAENRSMLNSFYNKVLNKFEKEVLNYMIINKTQRQILSILLVLSLFFSIILFEQIIFFKIKAMQRLYDYSPMAHHFMFATVIPLIFTLTFITYYDYPKIYIIHLVFCVMFIIIGRNTYRKAQFSIIDYSYYRSLNGKVFFSLHLIIILLLCLLEWANIPILKTQLILVSLLKYILGILLFIIMNVIWWPFYYM